MQRWQGRFLSHCGKVRRYDDEVARREADLSFGRVAIETRLSGAVASALAVICVEGEVKIHYIALELNGREGVRGHGDGERRKEVLCGGVDMKMVSNGGRGH